MIKLQVLRYMGILTVMKLGIFAISVFTIVVGLTWFFIYSPAKVMYASASRSKEESFNVHNLADHAEFENFQLASNQGQNQNELEAFDKNRDDHSKLIRKEGNSAGENVIPRHLYTDEVFENLMKELNQKHVDGFELMANSTNLVIYRRPKGNAGLYEYRLYAVTPEATPEEITAVFLDNEYRLIWDVYVTDIYTVRKNEEGPNVIYFNIDLPWPLANRDYVYARETRRQIRNDVEFTSIVMHSVLHDSIPHVNGVIRVNDYHQSIVMTRHGARGSRMYINYYDDPKGSIPSWLVNWAAKTGVPSFLDDLQRACAGLNQFLQKHNKKMLTLPLHS